MEVAGWKMPQFSMGVKKMDRIRNEYIKGTTEKKRLGDIRREIRLRCFRHVMRKDTVHVHRRKNVVDGAEDEEGQRRRSLVFISTVRNDMQMDGVTKDT